MKPTFASRTQAALVWIMLASFALLTQQLTNFVEVGGVEVDVGLRLYQAGLVTLFVSSILQIAFGNLPPGANFGKSLRLLSIALGVVAAVFGTGILLVPFLTQLGR
ncbi:hypothetical protein BH24DEI2_BH24DEI2_08740 [soil metagenome]